MPKPKKDKIKINIKPVFHIFCEGMKTEPYYINAFINFFHSEYRNVLVVEKAKKNTPVQLVEEAIQAKTDGGDNDIYWVVFDRESVSKYPHDLHLQARQKAQAHNIEIAFSNVCFEIWLLMHFTKSSACYTCCQDAISQSILKRKLSELGIPNYDKGLPFIFDKLKKNIPEAIINAELIMNDAFGSASSDQKLPHYLNPYTNVHELFIDIKNFTEKMGGNKSIKLTSGEERVRQIKSALNFYMNLLK